MKFGVTDTAGRTQILTTRKDVAALAAVSLKHLYPDSNFRVVHIDDMDFEEMEAYYYVLKSAEDAQVTTLFTVTSVTVNEHGTTPVLESIEDLGIYGRLGVNDYGQFVARTPEEARFLRV